VYAPYLICHFFFQTLARGLQEFLVYQGNVAEAFEQPFCIADVDMFGMPQVHKLKPDGDQIMVTNENRQVIDVTLSTVSGRPR
jgi:hypothetical protein